MASMQRAPASALRPFVRTLWLSAGDRGSASGLERREHVLPNGCAHLVFRVAGPGLRLFDGPDDPRGREVAAAVVGGARSSYYVREVSAPVRSIGAQLLPGAVPLLLGVPADELAERHTPLESLWGRASLDLQERLALARSPEHALALFEAELVARLPRVRGIHPAVAEALAGLEARTGVRELVARSGYSHRRFSAVFRESVGLGPKRYARVLRFEAALGRIAAAARPGWAELALAAGYCDQPHLQRDFRELAGITPGRYGGLALREAHHVPVGR
jgi:AraC-like DNA-binding protein